MPSIRILYIGPSRGTSAHRVEALRRLGHEVAVVDPRKGALGASGWQRYIFHSSGAGLQHFFWRTIFRNLPDWKPDLVWVNQEPFLGPYVVSRLRRFGVPVIVYVNDDPYAEGSRWRRFRSFRAALGIYDLVAAVRDPNVAELKAAGARKVIRVRMAADEVIHAPPDITPEDRKRLSSEVAFIGAYFPERGPFLERLVELGVPLSIWGPGWKQAPEWPRLSSVVRGASLSADTDYPKAVSLAKVSLGLLSKQNRDTHTTRSVEIPALGSVLCAERTDEHLDMYQEGREAVFWQTPEECAEVCAMLLADPERRAAIASAGQHRALTSGYLNESVLTRILDAVPSPVTSAFSEHAGSSGSKSGGTGA